MTGKIVKEEYLTKLGNQITTTYVVGKLLGKGGFAKVYEIRSYEDNQLMAVKVIPKSQLEKARAKAKLTSEIKIHRAMKHEGIARFLKYFEDEENVYILIELCSNQTLNDLVKRRKRLSEIEV